MRTARCSLCVADAPHILTVSRQGCASLGASCGLSVTESMIVTRPKEFVVAPCLVAEGNLCLRHMEITEANLTDRNTAQQFEVVDKLRCAQHHAA